MTAKTSSNARGEKPLSPRNFPYGQVVGPAFRCGSYYFGSDIFDNTASGGIANLETYAALTQTAEDGEETEDLVSAATNRVYLAQSPETFEYDDDGNQTLVATRTGLWRVTYNGENRPIRWENIAAESNIQTISNQTILTMSYDHVGRRREKNNQRFFYDGYLQVADNGGNVYTWDPTENVATRPLAWNSTTSQHPTSQLLFYTRDGNKNVSEVIAADGTIAAHYEYAPFGAVTESLNKKSANYAVFTQSCRNFSDAMLAEAEVRCAEKE